jgi:hypothetical protein
MKQDKTQTTPEEAMKVLTATLYKKHGKNYLDTLYQGGLIEKMLNIRYNTETQEIETEVVHVR